MPDAQISQPRFFLLAGSASRATDSERIDRAHHFVRELVKVVLARGDGFVVFAISEPVNAAMQPLVFDWTVLREVEATHKEAASAPRIVLVSSEKARAEKMSADQRRLLALLAQRNLLEVINLDVVTGGNIGDEQADRAVGMIALGGGKGVLDRSMKLRKRGRPVYPIDLKLGALSEDGEGALALHRSFMTQPLSFLSHTGAVAQSKSLALSLEEPIQEVPEIAKQVVEILESELDAELSAAPTDILVLTALPVELEAARLAFEIPEDTPPSKTEVGQNHWRTQLRSRSGVRVTCTLATFGTAGNVEAAAQTATLLSEFQPKVVVMIGIAAGMRDKCALGDVVLAERVVAYEGAAVLEGGTKQSRPETFRSAFRLQQDLAAYMSASTSIKARLETAWTGFGLELPESSDAGEVSKSVLPKLATIGSGEKLLRDPDMFRQLRELHGKVEVAEMEGAGIFTACANHNNTPAMVVRGISDFGDSTKDNQFHALAARAAAIVAADLAVNGLTF